MYQIKDNDTLLEIARQFDLGFVELRAANPKIDPWIPEKGTEITLPTRHLLPKSQRRGIVINLGEMRLYSFDLKGAVVDTMPIGIGRQGMDTPLGKTTIVRKQKDPYWHPTDRMRREDPTLKKTVPPGPDNPLGQFALYLDWPTFLVHGTNKPWGVGRRVSSGCIRLYPEDIERVFLKTSVHTPVEVVNQPIKVGWIGNVFYLEAHPFGAQADAVELGEQIVFDLEDGFSRTIVEAIGSYATKLDWKRVHQVLKERRGYPIPILAIEN